MSTWRSSGHLGAAVAAGQGLGAGGVAGPSRVMAAPLLLLHPPTVAAETTQSSNQHVAAAAFLGDKCTTKLNTKRPRSGS